MKKKSKFILVLFFLCNIDLHSQCNRQNVVNQLIIPSCLSGYVLEWEDNFNGNTLDLSTWELRTSHQGAFKINCGNNTTSLDQEYNTLDNVEVSNGTLKIRAKHEGVTRRLMDYCPPQCAPCLTNQDIDDCIMCDGYPNLRNYDWTSSSIWTKNKHDFREGKYEMMFRIDPVKGLWPAFWLFSGDSEPGGTKWSELDMFEIYHDGNSFKYTNNMHFDLNNDGGTGGEKCNYSSGFNSSLNFNHWTKLTVYFKNDRIAYYIDDVLVNRKVRYITSLGQNLYCGNGQVAAGSALEIKGWPRNPMQLVINMAVELKDNPPNNVSHFPAVFEVDYVRFYKNVKACDDNVNITAPFFGHHTGNSALLHQNAVLYNNHTASITAIEQIAIKPNTIIKPSSTFIARIDPNACFNQRLANDSAVTNFTVDRTPTDSTLNNKVAEQNLATNNLNINVYPNPNNGQFNIEINNLKGEVIIELVDLFGKTIYNEINTKSNYTFDLSRYPKGMYLLKTTINSVLSVQKIIYQ